jgi:hypothetical protein
MPPEPPPAKGLWKSFQLAMFSHLSRSPWFKPPSKESLDGMRIKRQDDNELWLDLRPRGDETALYQQLTVILDQQTSLPRAVRLVDSPGTKETVITYRSPRIEWKRDREKK